MDLKSFREDKLKIKTQSAFAELLGVEQSQISRWEKDPSSISVPTIQLIMSRTGATFEEVTGWTKPVIEPLNVADQWEKVDFTKKSLLDYIESALDSHAITDEEKEQYIKGLKDGLLQNLVKPQVTIVGRSDTGKSTIINALLGTDKMPTSWTPTTSIAVYIKHMDDRPSFIEEDVWVFKNQVGKEQLWNERRLNDEAYCRQWKIAAGEAGVLKSFGTRQGEKSDKQAGSAVVFVDSPILKNCDIVDLPGFGTELESDDTITFEAAQRSDVIIYLSQANGFMRIEDITYLKQNISSLPVWEQQQQNKLKPLSNLFVVASQSHTVNSGNREELKGILNTGCNALLKTLPAEYWAGRKTTSGYDYVGYGKLELRDRFYTYTTDIPDLCKKFNASLKETLETLPSIIDGRAKIYVENYVATQKPNLQKELHKYQGIVDERDKYIELLNDIKVKELERCKSSDARKTQVLDAINILKQESMDEFSDYISETINIDALVHMMKARGVSNKKADIEQFGSYLQSVLQERCEDILKKKSEQLAGKTEDYIQGFSEDIGTAFNKNNIELDFDVAWVFASALSALSLLGGLGAFVYSVGWWYALGISFGTAFTMGTMTVSLFGPIGIAVGLILFAGLGILKLFGGGWEKKVAKKIVSAFESEGIPEKFREGIAEHWNQTTSAFNVAAANLEEKWRKYVKDLEKTVNEYDINQLDCKIKSLKNVSDFFDYIPL